MKLTRALSLILSLLFLLSSCTAALPEADASTDMTETADATDETDAPSPSRPPYRGDYPALLDTGAVEYHSALPVPAHGDEDALAVGKHALALVSDETRATWREPLARLLSNLYLPIVEDYDVVGYRPSLDPDLPAVPNGVAYALSDVTLDGVPELLVFPHGYAGSSGAATHYAYDIHTGESVAVLDGTYATYAPHYCLRDGRIYLLSEYTLRAGATGGSHSISLVARMEGEVWSEEVPYLPVRYQTTSHLFADYVVQGDPTEGVTPFLLYYSIRHGAVDAADYYFELAFLRSELIPIDGTKAGLLRWSDVAKDIPEEDYVARGAAMADALLALDQEFLQFQ